MMKHSSLSVIRTHMRGRYLHNHNLRSRIVTRGLRRRRSWWRKGGMVSLMISGILLIIGVALGKAIRPWEARSTIPYVVQHTRVVIVKDDILPPVMQRIAQCESQNQHFTKDGKVVRGKWNPHDMGLFQINTVVWGKKAEELGYDIRTQEGNEQMARYIFENYGSVPWQASAKCWSRVN
jgi:hypothetical protein